MSISELAMREHATNLVQTIEAMLASAEASLGAGAYARGQKSGISCTLEAVRSELADYLPLEVSA